MLTVVLGFFKTIINPYNNKRIQKNLTKLFQKINTTSRNSRKNVGTVSFYVNGFQL